MDDKAREILTQLIQKKRKDFLKHNVGIKFLDRNAWDQYLQRYEITEIIPEEEPNQLIKQIQDIWNKYPNTIIIQVTEQEERNWGIPKVNVLSMLVTPEDFALKCLTLGELPP